ncbi:MAG: hypothetical protein F6K26_21000 [Moorea sp. SIO2I5]|nr:hypothetical protein [Moorena sp. SIO2I5]
MGRWGDGEMGRWAEEKVVPLTATWYEYRKFKSDAAQLPGSALSASNY